MSTFSIGGLATGLDTASIISKLMDVERAPEKLLQNKQKTYQSQIDTYTSIKTALQNLQNAAAGINTAGTFSGTQTSVTDSSVATATSSSAASPGLHTLQVNTLARNQRQVTTGYADGTSFNTGSFTIDDGAGNTTTIDITNSNNTLQGIASAINGSGANVSASIINDGSANPFRLVITGKDTKNYTVDMSGLTNGGVGTPTLLDSSDPSYQAGVDASFTLDGVAMTGGSNTITDALSGVTLNLLKEGGATTNFSVANDNAGVTKKINDFVSAYNSAITLVGKQTSYDSNTKSGGVLLGDATIRQIQTQLQHLVATTVSGATGSFTNLAQIGITTNKDDGTLKVDSTKLSSALSGNFNDVVDLFTHNGGTFATLPTEQYGIAQQFNLILDGLVNPYLGPDSTSNGLISTRINGLKNSITDIDDQITSMETRISSMQESMQKQFNAMETMVSNLQAQGNQLLAALGMSSTQSK